MPNIGIVAAQLLAIGGAEDESGVVGPTLIDFDFLNEIYEVNGIPTTAAAILTTPGDVGVSGLNIPLFGTPNVILGDAVTILLSADWTIAIEFGATATGGNMDLFSLADTSIGPPRDIFRCGYPNSPFKWWAQDIDEAATGRSAVSISDRSTGIHKMAITRTDTKLVIAVDGEISLINTGTMVLDDADTATFGGPASDSNGREANIRSFVAYNTQTDDILLALSL